MIAHCRTRLAIYKVPVRVVAVDEFPTTPSANGTKIQRNKLRDRRPPNCWRNLGLTATSWSRAHRDRECSPFRPTAPFRTVNRVGRPGRRTTRKEADMANFTGMDIPAVRNLSKQLKGRADEIQSIQPAAQRAARLDAVAGPGPQQFHGEWNGQYRQALNTVVQGLEQAAVTAKRNANEQEQASSR